jgi:MoxR-like ATPase
METDATKIKITEWDRVLAYVNALPEPPPRQLCFGLPGTGKTTYGLSLSPETERVTLTAGQFPDALLGKFLLRDGSTFWHDGPATRAARKGIPLLIDEIHEGGDELNSTLQAVLDDLAVCKLNLDNGEVITPAAGYRVIATMNGNPDQLKDAVLDRFDIALRCDTPHAGILRRLSPEGAAFLLNKMANEPRAEEWTPKYSPRRQLSFESLRRPGVPNALAADLAFGEGQGKTMLMAMVDAARNSGKAK